MTDLIDRIDALVDEQMADGEPENGYDFDDPDFPTCPHCGRDWHGLRLTRRIQAMRNFGHFDPEYRYAEDDSPVLCEGSDFIGPRRPPSPMRPRAPFPGPLVQMPRQIRCTVIPVFAVDPESSARLRRYLQHVADQWRRMTEQIAATFDAAVLFGSGSLVYNEVYRTQAPCLPTPDVTVEFGPQNWHYELQRKQSDRYWISGAVWNSPVTNQVITHWRAFTAPDFPVPARPGYDFARYVPDDGPPVWAAPPPAPHHTRRPATARRAPRRGRSRR